MTAHLLSPLSLGHTELRNRVVMGSMHTGLEDRSRDLPKLAAYFAERAKGGVALAVTGGYAPNWHGWLSPAGSIMATRRMAQKHRIVTDAVHEYDGKIALQILHSGRYGYHPFSRGASDIKSPITPFKPKAMSTKEVDKTVSDYARAAKLAKEAGYDGVEIMGSEGYLINQMITARTNTRTDIWGQDRMLFPEEIIKRVRDVVGDDFIVLYRMSLLDLVDNAQSWDETVELAHRLQAAGVSIFNTGIGWHEARIPTIVTSVPRAAFSWVTAKLKKEVSIPVMASNRINTPEDAERIIANGEADLVSMARPLLADPHFVNKARSGEVINTCIACNQACLDHTFSAKRCTCLVNPRACYETELVLMPTRTKQRVAVVGGGPAGLSAAVSLAEVGHEVELFEAKPDLGGQFRLAMQIPGKEEFKETIRYYEAMLEKYGVKVQLNHRATQAELNAFDRVVIATGVEPRVPEIPGVEHALTYEQVINGAEVGKRVAVLGAGGIGFDVSEFLLHEPNETVEHWNKRWGVVDPEVARGGLGKPHIEPARREVFLLQRKSTPHGKDLGKTTGWVHRTTLKSSGVKMIGGVSYDRIEAGKLFYSIDGEPQVLEVDTVVLCTGQESVRELSGDHVIGGAELAMEIDAKRAIRQGVELAQHA